MVAHVVEGTLDNTEDHIVEQEDVEMEEDNESENATISASMVAHVVKVVNIEDHIVEEEDVEIARDNESENTFDKEKNKLLESNDTIPLVEQVTEIQSKAEENIGCIYIHTSNEPPIIEGDNATNIEVTSNISQTEVDIVEMNSNEQKVGSNSESNEAKDEVISTISASMVAHVVEGTLDNVEDYIVEQEDVEVEKDNESENTSISVSMVAHVVEGTLDNTEDHIVEQEDVEMEEDNESENATISASMVAHVVKVVNIEDHIVEEEDVEIARDNESENTFDKEKNKLLESNDTIPLVEQVTEIQSKAEENIGCIYIHTSNEPPIIEGDNTDTIPLVEQVTEIQTKAEENIGCIYIHTSNEPPIIEGDNATNIEVTSNISETELEEVEMNSNEQKARSDSAEPNSLESLEEEKDDEVTGMSDNTKNMETAMKDILTGIVDNIATKIEITSPEKVCDSPTDDLISEGGSDCVSTDEGIDASDDDSKDSCESDELKKEKENAKEIVESEIKIENLITEIDQHT